MHLMQAEGGVSEVGVDHFDLTIATSLSEVVAVGAQSDTEGFAVCLPIS